MPPFKPRSVNPEVRALTQETICEKAKYIRGHVDKIEKIFSDEAKELELSWQTELERTKNDEDDSCVDFGSSQSLMEIEYIYLRMHRYSAILAIYAYLELSMNNVCFLVKQKHKLPVDVTDFKGDGIERSKLYLEKMGKLDFSTVNPVWARVRLLNKVRNCIMHANGDAAEVRRGDFVKTVHGTNGLSFVEKSLIHVSKEFVLSSIEDMKELLSHLLKLTNYTER